MKITQVDHWREKVPLTRPYSIAGLDTSDVDLFFVRIEAEGGLAGLGSASPAMDVTGETSDVCQAALAHHAMDALVGKDARHRDELCALVAEQAPAAPAARAALDMALHDLFARILDVPLVDVLGKRRISPLPTSITLGIRSVDESLEEAREYMERGFRCLKVKIGRDIEEDLERLHRLRDLVGPDIAIRVDANQGYDPDETLRLFAVSEKLTLELLEQPMSAEGLDDFRSLPEDLRKRVALDESVLDEKDAARLLLPTPACGTFVVKLMKCGGITPALAIANQARQGGVNLMWGCMDESVISIAAALHVAYACEETRYLDLDGSLDLSRDLAEGGFSLKDGILQLQEGPGLGVELTGA